MAEMSPVPSFNEYSFTKLKNEDHVSIYYTLPAKATPMVGTDHVLQYIESTLARDENQEWKWIIDATDFTMHHAMELSTAKALCQLFDKKHTATLKQIIIVHPSWHIHTLFYLLWPFMSNFIQTIIVIQSSNDRDGCSEISRQ